MKRIVIYICLISSWGSIVSQEIDTVDISDHASHKEYYDADTVTRGLKFGKLGCDTIRLCKILKKLCSIDSKIDAFESNIDIPLFTICEKIENACTSLKFTICDKVNNTVESLSFTICDKIEKATLCDPTPVTTSTTISISDHYCLANDITGDVLITATNVVFDLNGHIISGGTNGIVVTGNEVFIHNGTVRNASEAGIKVTGDKNKFEGLDLVANTTGMELVGANANVVRESRALCNTSAGFSLVLSQRNCITNNKAINNCGGGNVFGFVSVDGMCNLFDANVAENNKTTDGAPFFAAGFMLGDIENNSKIIHSQASCTRGDNSFGILLNHSNITTAQARQLLENVDFTLDELATASSGSRTAVAWQVCDGTSYLATGGISGNEIEIFEFDSFPGSLTSIAISDSRARALDWLENSKLLAVGGVDGTLDKVQIFEFDPDAQSVVGISNLFDHTADVHAVKWLVCDNTKYVAIGGANAMSGSGAGAEVRVLEYDCTTSVLSEVISATFDNGSLVLDLDWLVCDGAKFLAFGQSGTTNPLRVVEFDVTNSVLRSVESVAVDHTQAVAWLVCDTSKYLAVGRGESPFIRIYEFDTTTSQLTEIADFVDTSSVHSVDWHVCNGIKYLAIGTSDPTQVTVLEFEPIGQTLTEIVSFTHGNTIFSVDWLESNGRTFLGIGGDQSNGITVRALQFNGCRLPFCNIVKKNHANNNVIGIRDDLGIQSTNQIYSNFSCKNIINFDIGPQFPISPARSFGVGETENIDCALGEDADEGEDVGALACAPIPVFTPTTISLAGHYCAANEINGEIRITAKNVLLDLNGQRIRNIVIEGTTVSTAKIHNGFVVDSPVNGIFVDGGAGDFRSPGTGNNLKLENITITNAAENGIHMFSVRNVFVKDCLCCDNTLNGILVDTDPFTPVPRLSVQMVFQSCITNNNGANGIKFFNAERVTLNECTANNNTLSGILLERHRMASLRLCECHNNGRSGIALGSDRLDPLVIPFASDIKIADSTVSNNGVDGISMNRVGNALLSNCTFDNNTDSGILMRDGSAIQMNQCKATRNTFGFLIDTGLFSPATGNITGNVIDNSTANSNTIDGFRIGDPAGMITTNGNLIRGCSAVSNGEIGFNIIQPGSSSNLIRECEALLNEECGFFVDMSVTASNIIASCTSTNNGSGTPAEQYVNVIQPITGIAATGVTYWGNIFF